MKTSQRLRERLGPALALALALGCTGGNSGRLTTQDGSTEDNGGPTQLDMRVSGSDAEGVRGDQGTGPVADAEGRSDGGRSDGGRADGGEPLDVVSRDAAADAPSDRVSEASNEVGTDLPLSDSALPDAALPPPPDLTEEMFNLDFIHVVDIEVDLALLDELENDRVNRIPCTFTFDGVRREQVGIRQKGGIGSVSSLDEKPGFSVSFDEFVEGQELFGLEKVRLNNAIQDGTFLHEHLGYEIARQSGLPAARTSHAVVRLNGRSYGVYVVAEAIDEDFLQRHFGQMNDDGNLYEGPCCADFVFDIPHMELKDEAEGRLRDDLTALAAIIRDAPFEDWVELVSPVLDLDVFVRSYALDALLAHWDGYAYNTNNHYIYHRPDDDRFSFFPHGMDQVLDDAFFDPYRWPQGRLAQRVLEDPRLTAGFTQAMRSILVDHWDLEALNARIDRVTVMLEAAPFFGDLAAAHQRQYLERVQGVKDMLAQRKEFVLNLVDAVCGDGTRDGREECDDGNLLDGDACDSFCIVEPRCGDEFVSANEDCDDGNVMDGDGCDARCRVEDCVPARFAAQEYAFCPRPRTVIEARALCAERGGALAFPNNGLEHRFQVNTAFGIGRINWWVGVDDEANEGVWALPNGARVFYFAWGDGRPNGAEDQNCVVIDAGLGGGWNDKACSEEHGTVCHVPRVP